MYRRPVYLFLEGLKNVLSGAEQRVSRLVNALESQSADVSAISTGSCGGIRASAPTVTSQAAAANASIQVQAQNAVLSSVVQDTAAPRLVSTPAIVGTSTQAEGHPGLLNHAKDRVTVPVNHSFEPTIALKASGDDTMKLAPQQPWAERQRAPKQVGPKEWYVIDAMNLIYRFYHARNHHYKARPSTLNETSLAMLSMLIRRLIRLVDDHAKDGNPLVMVFDARHHATKSGQRIAILPTYKKGRPPMPEDLKRIVPELKAASFALGANLLELGGFEADDVIGSLATQVRDRGEKMYIVSNDKDFQQLLEDDKIFLLKPVFNSKEKRWSTMTAEDFRESNHGLDPCKYPDIQALTGDAVDNVPGVKGIGQRIAPFLLSKSANKDLESLLADVDVLDDKYKREYVQTRQNNRKQDLRGRGGDFRDDRD
uniref:5'-3' exonuclease domain-containing protein n=1 Tax=Rhodosorus marinus TaxID=101924 RepID=A0A7S3EN13_9RHOD|mmetsp:Transcript_7375/g.32813  ORF Transcript_7375/g.32813 Transcript_7375/m.32813 type:complete len:426 (+) Transcript_7375:350-1627(+)